MSSGTSGANHHFNSRFSAPFALNDQTLFRPFFSITYELPILCPLCFDIHPSGIQTFRLSDALSFPPPVPLRPNPLGATIAIGATFLRSPGKQLRPPRCLTIKSGHRGQLDKDPRCRSCLSLPF